MKINVNGEKILDLQPWQEKVIKHDILEEEFDEDMKRRIQYAIQHKFDQCYKRFEAEWLEKLRKDPEITSIPTDKKDFVEMVMARADYQNRSQKEKAQANSSQ